MTPFTRVVRGEWKPAANEILKPSVTTKMCFIVGLALFVLDPKLADIVSYLSFEQFKPINHLNHHALDIF